MNYHEAKLSSDTGEYGETEEVSIGGARILRCRGRQMRHLVVAGFSLRSAAAPLECHTLDSIAQPRLYLFLSVQIRCIISPIPTERSSLELQFPANESSQHLAR